MEVCVTWVETWWREDEEREKEELAEEFDDEER